MKTLSLVPGRELRPHIADYRRRAGLTQAELARAMGVSRETICRLENDRVYLTERMEDKLAFHLNISLHERNHAFGLPGATYPIERTEAQSRRATLAIVRQPGSA